MKKLISLFAMFAFCAAVSQAAPLLWEDWESYAVGTTSLDTTKWVQVGDCAPYTDAGPAKVLIDTSQWAGHKYLKFFGGQSSNPGVGGSKGRLVSQQGWAPGRNLRFQYQMQQIPSVFGAIFAGLRTEQAGLSFGNSDACSAAISGLVFAGHPNASYAPIFNEGDGPAGIWSGWSSGTIFPFVDNIIDPFLATNATSAPDGISIRYWLGNTSGCFIEFSTDTGYTWTACKSFAGETLDTRGAAPQAGQAGPVYFTGSQVYGNSSPAYVIVTDNTGKTFYAFIATYTADNGASDNGCPLIDNLMVANDLNVPVELSSFSVE